MVNELQLDKIIEKLLKEHNTPSLQIAIIQNGEITVNKAYGFRDYDHKIKADTNTIYAIGSSTKAFTATAIAKLVEEGKLEWDKPVKHYIPEFEMYNKHSTEELTVKDILCHRCGLPRHDYVWNSNNYTGEELMRKLRYLKPIAPLRYALYYNNHMYALAGYLIEKVTGKKWCDYINEVIVKPLEMKSTGFNTEKFKQINNKALPYNNENNEIKFYEYNNTLSSKDSTVGAAGSMFSNAESLIKWVNLNLNKGNFKGKQIIDKKEINECQTPQMINKTMYNLGFEEIDFQSYGLGWFIESFKGNKVIYHGGNINGFSAMVGFIPGINSGFAYLTNLNASMIQNILSYYIYDLLLGNVPKDYNDMVLEKYKHFEGLAKKHSEEFKNSFDKDLKPSFDLKEYAGKFYNPAYGIFEIAYENGELFYQSKKGKFLLEHLSLNSFLTEIVFGVMKKPVTIEYKTDIYGKITSINTGIESSLKEGVEFKKI